ncbi:MAG: hypothetical protein O2897_06270 [bacterium]|nr:hypothetical protein [bacterium]
MKKLFLCFNMAAFIFASTLVYSATSNSTQLTPQQSKQTLEVIDDICGDTWCEGDEFNFRTINCENDYCTLTYSMPEFNGHSQEIDFIILPGEGSIFEIAKQLQAKILISPAEFQAQCTFPYDGNYESMVKIRNNTYPAISEELYEMLTECLNVVESWVNHNGVYIKE